MALRRITARRFARAKLNAPLCAPLRTGALSYSAVQLLSYMEKLVRTLTEFEEEATGFAESLAPRFALDSATKRRLGATLITLSGELGAGKTAFVKAVARALGVEEGITSPTFVLEKISLLPPELGHRMSKFRRLVHIDAYRLERGSDLAPLGFDELMQNSENLILLEWPERVADALPGVARHISFKMLPDGSREISYAET